MSWTKVDDTETTKATAVTAIPAEPVLIPLAVYAEARYGQPGAVVVCASCPPCKWFPRSKHGDTLRLEYENEHLGHTRQEKHDD